MYNHYKVMYSKVFYKIDLIYLLVQAIEKLSI
jgi:hypothetical protein